MNDRKFDKWFAEKGKIFAVKLGLKESMKVFEFGAGSGNYTVGLSQAVGTGGKVFAAESDHDKYPALKEKIKKYSLSNVEIYDTKGSVEIDIGVEFDFILFYDVIHYFGAGQRSKIYDMSAKLLKKGGILSLFPKHRKNDNWPRGEFGKLDDDEVKNEVMRAEFELILSFKHEIIHDNEFEVEDIWNFVKKA